MYMIQTEGFIRCIARNIHMLQGSISGLKQVLWKLEYTFDNEVKELNFVKTILYRQDIQWEHN